MSWKRAREIQPETYDGDNVSTGIVMLSVFMIIVAVFMGMWADYSGILRYVIMLTFVTLVLMIPAYLLFQNSAVSRIPEQERPVFRPKGDLEEIRSVMKRGLKGYHASQVMLEDRLRQDLIQRISIRKRIPIETVREESKEYSGALRLSGDEDLAVLLSRRKKMGRDKRTLFVRPEAGYKEWIVRVIEKMEEWK
jgi:hypothetical protein